MIKKARGEFMAVKLPAICVMFILMAAGFGCMGREGHTADAEGSGDITAKARIDEECRSHPATFTIPEGKTAHEFKSSGLEAGKACHEGGAPENKGFAIRDSKNQPVYMWSQYKDQKPYEKGGPLSSLTLDAGEYTLSVAGGAGAKVEISFKLK
jgi:hypothetical protein